MENVEALRLALEGSCRSDDEVQADGLLPGHVSYYLELLLVDMGVEAKSNYMLEPVQNRVVSLSVLPVALLQVWHV